MFRANILYTGIHYASLDTHSIQPIPCGVLFGDERVIGLYQKQCHLVIIINHKSLLNLFQVGLSLRDSWISSLKLGIRSALRDVGKGWFNIHETKWEVYQISKLKKFMETVKFIMQVSCVPFHKFVSNQISIHPLLLALFYRCLIQIQILSLLLV